MKNNKKKLTVALLFAAALIIIIPLFALKGAEFGGSDDAGSVMVEEISGKYEPWFTPVLEQALNGEIPGEIESLGFPHLYFYSCPGFAREFVEKCLRYSLLRNDS